VLEAQDLRRGDPLLELPYYAADLDMQPRQSNRISERQSLTQDGRNTRDVRHCPRIWGWRGRIPGAGPVYNLQTVQQLRITEDHGTDNYKGNTEKAADISWNAFWDAYDPFDSEDMGANIVGSKFRPYRSAAFPEFHWRLR